MNLLQAIDWLQLPIGDITRLLKTLRAAQAGAAAALNQVDHEIALTGHNTQNPNPPVGPAVSPNPSLSSDNTQDSSPTISHPLFQFIMDRPTAEMKANAQLPQHSLIYPEDGSGRDPDEIRAERNQTNLTKLFNG